MDPLTHGIIGGAISAFSSETVSLTNPITLGAVIGSIIPDIDVVIRLIKDDMYYLNNHRGKSHSIYFLILYSVIITFILNFMFQDMNILKVFLFTFLGSLSHTLMDTLNSYGAMLFNKKLKFNLLTLYDPVITITSLFLIFYKNQTNVTLLTSTLFISLYLFFRLKIKKKAYIKLNREYNGKKIEEITILPSLKFFYKWDFIISTRDENIVGRMNYFTNNIEEFSILKKSDKRFEDVFLTTKLGNCFSKYTPNIHISHKEFEDKYVLNVSDLRYFFKNDFLHNATLVLDKNFNVIKSYAHPYSRKKYIEIGMDE